jgi:hypothetical protein
MMRLKPEIVPRMGGLSKIYKKMLPEKHATKKT